MKKTLQIIFAFVMIIGLLPACGGNDTENEASRVEEPTEAKREFTTLEELQNMDLEAEDFNWEDIYLSEATFKELLNAWTEADEQGEILLKRAELVDRKTVELTMNNSDGESLENAFQAAFLDAFIRQFYKHSELYENQEPTIRVLDLSGYVIMENDAPLDFGDEQGEGADLGEFGLGEQVDVSGHLITINNPRFTDERNQFEEQQPEKVLVFDIAYQNNTGEEQFISAGDFDVYDAKGTKMETYPIDYLMDSVREGKNISGRGAFGVTGNAPYELYYTDFFTGATAKWVLKP